MASSFLLRPKRVGSSSAAVASMARLLPPPRAGLVGVLWGVSRRRFWSSFHEPDGACGNLSNHSFCFCTPCLSPHRPALWEAIDSRSSCFNRGGLAHSRAFSVSEKTRENLVVAGENARGKFSSVAHMPFRRAFSASSPPMPIQSALSSSTPMRIGKAFSATSALEKAREKSATAKENMSSGKGDPYMEEGKLISIPHMHIRRDFFASTHMPLWRAFSTSSALEKTHQKSDVSKENIQGKLISITHMPIRRAFSTSSALEKTREKSIITKENIHRSIEGESNSLSEMGRNDDDGDDEDDTEGRIEEDMEWLLGELTKMEKTMDPADVRIALACLRLAQMHDALDEDPAKVIEFADRAMRIMGNDGSLDTATCHHCLGSAYYKMERFEKSLIHLERCVALLVLLEKTTDDWELRPLKHATFFLLGHAKMALGRDEEAYKDYMESLAINERHLEPGNPDLALAYEQVSKACLEMGKHEEAIALCKKGLTISENFYGHGSLQVALARKIMATVYGDAGEYEKVLEEHEKIRPILEAHSRLRDVVALDWASSQALMALGRHEETLTTLDKVLANSEESEFVRGLALISQAKAHLATNENVDAIIMLRCCTSALSVLNLHETVDSGAALIELADVLQKLGESERADDVLRQAIAVLQKLPEGEEELADAESELGMLLLCRRKGEEALPLLTKAAGTFERLHGLNNEKLLSVYNHLGIANLELQNAEKAVELFEKAKRIAVDCMGLDDPDTIAVYINLVNVYSDLGRYDKAIGYQRLVVETLRTAGEGASFSLDEAEKQLEEILQKAGGKA